MNINNSQLTDQVNRLKKVMKLKKKRPSNPDAGDSLTISDINEYLQKASDDQN